MLVIETIIEESHTSSDVIAYTSKDGNEVITHPHVNQQGWLHKVGSSIRVPGVFTGNGKWQASYTDDY